MTRESILTMVSYPNNSFLNHWQQNVNSSFQGICSFCLRFSQQINNFHFRQHFKNCGGCQYKNTAGQIVCFLTSININPINVISKMMSWGLLSNYWTFSSFVYFFLLINNSKFTSKNREQFCPQYKLKIYFPCH